MKKLSVLLFAFFCLFLLTATGSMATFTVENSTVQRVQTGSGISFYYIFDSVGSSVATGKNETLSLNLGNVNVFGAMFVEYKNAFRITNKGPATTLTYEVISKSKPTTSPISIASLITVDQTVMKANETKAITIDFEVTTIFGLLGGTYEGMIRVKDSSTNLTKDIPVQFRLTVFR